MTLDELRALVAGLDEDGDVYMEGERVSASWGRYALSVWTPPEEHQISGVFYARMAKAIAALEGK